MDLIVVATNKEAAPFLTTSHSLPNFHVLITGAGCIETTLSLTHFLCTKQQQRISRVINVGVAGAYPGSGLRPLDVCFARQEIFADFGVCFGDTIDNLSFSGCPENSVTLTSPLLEEAINFQNNRRVPFTSGNFLTVAGVTGTVSRGDFLQKKLSALCENMEGFAVARVCQEFNIACLEVRCISNMVTDRDVKNWPIDQACSKLADYILPFLASHQEQSP